MKSKRLVQPEVPEAPQDLSFLLKQRPFAKLEEMLSVIGNDRLL
jgi:hypothetical protein